MARGTRFELRPDDPHTFPEWVRHRARIGGDKLALEIDGVARSYAELDDRTDRFAAGFTSLGLEPGDHVSLMMGNSIENVEAWFGLQKAAIVEVPVHTASRGAALQYIVDHADAKALVIDELFLPQLLSVIDSLPKLRQVIVNRGEPADEAVVLPSRLARHDLAEVADTGAPVPTPNVDRRDTAVVLHSSGTTGPPKGVVLSHEAVLHLTRHLVWLMDYTADDRLYTAFPLFHNNAKYTSVCAALEAGGSCFMDKRFPVKTFWEMARDKELTAFNYMGALLMMLYKQPRGPADADNPIRIAFGAPCPVEIWDDFESRFGVKLVEVYGMTEAPMACENRLDNRKIGSAGKESMTYEVRIVDEWDQPVPPNAPGEIAIRPKIPGAIFSGYYGREADTVEAWRNLWFHTGDRGTMDEDGFLFFLDRMKDCIRRRGENISSWEVESTINTHEAVLESAAYGVASDLSESDVMVAVVLQAGATLAPEELLDYCAGRMAHFAVPRYVRFLDALPKNASERVEKFKLREDGVTRDTWDREVVGYKVAR
jgi:crotonobetaine/carnitine-CoA ligase